MRTIYKYPINSGFSSVTMPKGAKVFSAALDGEAIPCVWAAINTEEEELEERTIYLTGTGWPLDYLEENFGYRFIDTIVEADTGFVWHVFEITDKGCNCQML